MIRRITGLLAAAAVIGIIAWTALGRGKYTSAFFTGTAPSAYTAAQTDAPRQEPAPETPVAADSLALPAGDGSGLAADRAVPDSGPDEL